MASNRQDLSQRLFITCIVCEDFQVFWVLLGHRHRRLLTGPCCREVAAKFMLDNKDPKKTRRFIEEAQITGQLEHPNILPVHDLGLDAKKRMYMVMKLVKGRSLQQLLENLRSSDTGEFKK